MTRPFLLAAAMLAVPPAGRAADVTDLSGTWQVSGRIEAGGNQVAQATPVCEFKQSDRTLSGACKGPRAAGPASGTVAGRHIAWKWQATATSVIGVSSTAAFQGDLGADGVIHGTWTLERLPGLTGAFTATRKSPSRALTSSGPSV